ncbi:hypothetical protein GGX14DRAFT_626787 [Mycena pura]|uniref:F-box domain-containing protein n=1 Tax=Mycena pura TaxID=153505 RepID=A0AAD6YQR5_9AGAR|nr:hypothetical protein GGX14DRAFT_626787 [Mycena pura]
MPVITAAAALRAQLDDIEKSMAALEAQMTSLRAQKEQVLKDLGNLTYPVLTLPNEVAIEIFLHVISLMRKQYDLPQPYYSLLRLASVCQTWRAVTLSTHVFWNKVEIDCNCIRDAGKLLEVCLPRAGNLPLDLDIQLPADVSSTDTIISTLSLYGLQWQRIHLQLALTSPSLIFPIQRFPGSLPLLESLSLSGFSDNYNFVSPPRHVPQLRELTLMTPSMAIGLPFNQLTKLNLLDYFSTAQLLVVLPHALNLECLELGYCAEDTRAATLSILLPRLHTFTWHRDQTAMVLQYLTLPALERLRFADLSDAGVNAIQSCVARSNSTIRTLDLIDLYDNAAYDCLRGFPTIRHLCVSGWWSNDIALLDSFFAAMISKSFLPALESLTWENCSPAAAHKFFMMVLARWRGVEGTTKLSSVSLAFDEDEDHGSDFANDYANALDLLYELGRQGLKLKITGPG